MQLGHPEKVPADAAVAILRQAVGAGVNHLDTAQFYGPCNDLIRTALSPYPADLVLATKVGAVHDDAAKPFPLVPAQRPAELRAQVGLAWQLAHYAGTLLIPGTANPAHLAENLAAGDLNLPDDSRTALNQLAPPAAG
jgi:aryl-alcohol dehydrogenase-like predicted oxidoreductase